MDSKNAYFEVCSLAGDLLLKWEVKLGETIEGVYVEKIENNIVIPIVLVKSFSPPTY